MLVSLILVSTLGLETQTPELEKIQTLPRSSDVYFAEITDLDVWPDGSVAVLDNLSHAILLFDSTGAHRATLSREGRGPGEILGADQLEIAPDGRIEVVDFRNLRVSFWSREGEFLDSHPLSEVLGSGAWWPQTLVHRPAGPFIKVSSLTDGPVQVLRLQPDWSGVEDTVVSYQPDDPAAVSCLFCTITVGPDGQVLAATGDTLYRIVALGRTGSAVRSWERDDLPAARRSESELRRLRARIGARSRAEGSEGKVTVSDHRPRFSGKTLATDPQGRLWALPSSAGTGSVIDVFGPAGHHLRTFELEWPIDRIAVRGVYLLAAGLNESGEPVVYQFRIVG